MNTAGEIPRSTYDFGLCRDRISVGRGAERTQCDRAFDHPGGDRPHDQKNAASDRLFGGGALKGGRACRTLRRDRVRFRRSRRRTACPYLRERRRGRDPRLRHRHYRGCDREVPYRRVGSTLHHPGADCAAGSGFSPGRRPLY